MDPTKLPADIVQFVSEGFERAKAGAAREVYDEVVEIFDQGCLPDKSHYPFGWIIYYAIHQCSANIVKERKLMLMQYLKLNVPTPHKLHSMILTEAIRLYKETANLYPPGFSIVKFADLWDMNNLRPGDWKRKKVDERELPSTVEKFITHYVDELYAIKTPPTDSFMAIVKRALEFYPGSTNLLAQYAQLHELEGRRPDAVEWLRKAILSAPSKFFLWGRLADLITDRKDLRLRISLLFRSLNCPGPEEFKGRLHLKLAEALIESGAFPQARWELTYVNKLYRRHEWNLPRLYRELEKKIPIITPEPIDPTPDYRRIAGLADDFIFETQPDIIARKTYHKGAASGKDRSDSHRNTVVAWRVTDADGRNYWFQPERFGINPNLPMGTTMAIKTFDEKVVKVSLIDA